MNCIRDNLIPLKLRLKNIRIGLLSPKTKSTTDQRPDPYVYVYVVCSATGPNSFPYSANRARHAA